MIEPPKFKVGARGLRQATTAGNLTRVFDFVMINFKEVGEKPLRSDVIGIDYNTHTNIEIRW